jgi:hypothetical protein
MSRLHVHIATADLEASIAFYSNLFQTPPEVVREGYASWRVSDPALNLDVSSNGSAPGVNHLGIHAQSEDELASVIGEGVPRSRCCGDDARDYWLTDAQEIRWERVLDPALTGVFSGAAVANEADQACCVPVAGAVEDGSAPCCVPGDERRAKAAPTGGCGCGCD